LFEQWYIVILDTGLRFGNDQNLIGIDCSDLLVKWVVGGVMNSPNQYDGVANVYIEDGRLWAGIWCGCALHIDHMTGEILQCKETK